MIECLPNIPLARIMHVILRCPFRTIFHVSGRPEVHPRCSRIGRVGNQQKWDTFVKERSGGKGRVLGLPEQAVVAFALG